MYEFNTFDSLIKCMAVQQNEWDTTNKEKKENFCSTILRIISQKLLLVSYHLFFAAKEIKSKMAILCWSKQEASNIWLMSNNCSFSTIKLKVQNSCFEVQEIGPTDSVRPLFTGLIENRHLDRSISSDPINSICRFDRIDGLDRPVDKGLWVRTWRQGFRSPRRSGHHSCFGSKLWSHGGPSPLKKPTHFGSAPPPPLRFSPRFRCSLWSLRYVFDWAVPPFLGSSPSARDRLLLNQMSRWLKTRRRSLDGITAAASSTGPRASILLRWWKLEL